MILAIVLGVIALALLAGGVKLIALGGTWYYLLAGLLVAGAAITSFTGRARLGSGLYGIMLAGTLIWTLAETGFEPWQLQARLAGPLVLAIWVFWPWIRANWKIAAGTTAVAIAAFAIWLVRANAWQDATDASARFASGVGDWPHYGNTLAGQRFSQLAQITPVNVEKLEPAWTYRTREKFIGQGFEATPLMVDNKVFLCTASNRIMALDPETGKELWLFDPKTDAPPASTCRGVSFYRTQAAQGGQCAARVIFATVDARLMAVDAETGKPCSNFGNAGTVDLKRGMGDVAKGYYYVSSAPTIVRGKVVLGGWVLDGQYVGEPSGVIRAFDAETGQFAWAWDMDRPNEHGEPEAGKTYSRGTANSWGPMSGDETLGLVFLPTGNSTPDYWGGHRSPGSEKYSASVVALNIETGQEAWTFQTSHHDVWDYDVSAQPTLVYLPIGGRTVPALIQATKRGQVFLLDRRTGKPLANVEERAVPQGAAQGDHLSPTQPFSTGMPSFDATVWTASKMWGLTPIDQMWCRIKFDEARYEGPMTPPGVKPTITYPSYLGGINWGGVSVDPERKLMIANYSRIANYTRLVPRNSKEAEGLVASKNGGIHVGQPVAQIGTPFAVFTGAFLSSLNVPCTQPPFGKIAAVDLKTRKVVWEKPLGTGADSGPMGIAAHLPIPMGVPNSGGSLTTRSGLTFIAATQEKAIRAFETATGKLLWHAVLPAGGHAAPMTYTSPKTGRQFIVIAAGGNAPLLSGAGDYVIAYALPQGTATAGK